MGRRAGSIFPVPSYLILSYTKAYSGRLPFSVSQANELPPSDPSDPAHIA